MRTLQETFDYVVDKIVEQGKQCMRCSYCVYRDGEGNHCAIGWLLDPDKSELMEFLGPIHLLLEKYPESLPPVVANNIQVFEDIQNFHDTCNMRNRGDLSLKIQRQGIDISNPNVQKWIDMGDKGE